MYKIAGVDSNIKIWGKLVRELESHSSGYGSLSLFDLQRGFSTKADNQMRTT